jgi:hypothetical protein
MEVGVAREWENAGLIPVFLRMAAETKKRGELVSPPRFEILLVYQLRER